MPITLWAMAGELTVLAPGPLLPLAAITTAPASKALSAAVEIALVLVAEPCISATNTRSSRAGRLEAAHDGGRVEPAAAVRVDLPAVERDPGHAALVRAEVAVAGDDRGRRRAVVPAVVVGVEAGRGGVVAVAPPLTQSRRKSMWSSGDERGVRARTPVSSRPM